MNIKHKIVIQESIKYAKSKYEKYFETEDDYLEVKVNLNDNSDIIYTCKVTKTNNVFNCEIIKEIDNSKLTRILAEQFYDVESEKRNNEIITK
jgi:hypothetical protein